MSYYDYIFSFISIHESRSPTKSMVLMKFVDFKKRFVGEYFALHRARFRFAFGNDTPTKITISICNILRQSNKLVGVFCHKNFWKIICKCTKTNEFQDYCNRLAILSSQGWTSTINIDMIELRTQTVFEFGPFRTQL